MDYITITVPDMNDSISSITLCGKRYRLRFTYNDTKDYWAFGVLDSLGEPIRSGIKIVPRMALNMFCGTDELPYGVFGVKTQLERIGRDDFKDGKAQFVFAPLEDEE